MISGRVREDRVRSGDELRAALSTACDSSQPSHFTNEDLNGLLEHAAQHKDSRDPLELKQQLASLADGLAKLTLRQRKAVMVALEKQLTEAKRLGLPERFWVANPPPPPPPPEPPRKPASKELILSPTPREGVGEGFTWTQSEAELTVTVPVPDGTGKQEVHLQMTPRYGPSQQLVLRAKFWPLPLLSGILHYEIDASEAIWHLGENGASVVVDLPKVEEKLWPGTPPVFVRNTSPLVEVRLPALEPADDTATSTLVAGLAPERLVQKMGQDPTDCALQLRCAALLSELFDANAGNVLAAANARGVPVLLKVLKNFGQQAQAQVGVWRALHSMVAAHSFLRKPILDADGMRVLLAGFVAHRQEEEVVVLLCLMLRALLPATPPRPFVEAGGLEVFCDSLLAHARSPLVAEVSAGCLHMLAGVNNIVRRMVLRMEVVPPLVILLREHPDRAALHEAIFGVLAQLSRGDATCAPFFSQQVQLTQVLRAARRHASLAGIQTDTCRILAALVDSEQRVMEVIDEGGLDLLLQAAEAHDEVAAVGNEVSNVLEQAVCVMCEAGGRDLPEEDPGPSGMAELLRSMHAATRKRRQLAEEAEARTAEAARLAAEGAEEERLRDRAEREEKIAAGVDPRLDPGAGGDEAPSAYGGFTWTSSFEDPRIGEDVADEPRIVELDDI